MTETKVGAELRETRINKGLSLGEVVQEIKISEKVLRAIEEGDFDNLPADVYSRGFVRLYAEHLGISPEETQKLVKTFISERAGYMGDTKKIVSPRITPVRARSKIQLSPRALTFIIAGVVGGIVLLYLLISVRGYTRSPSLELISPLDNTAVEGTSVAISGRSDPLAEVRVNGEQVFVDSDGMFQENVAVRVGLNTIEVRATSIGGGESVVTRTVLVQEPSSEIDNVDDMVGGDEGDSATAGAETEDTDGPFTLTVRTERESAWMYIEVDGEVAFSGILEAGVKRDVQGMVIRVTSGKGEATFVEINGRSEELLSEIPGVARDILFTRNPNTGIVEKQIDIP